MSQVCAQLLQQRLALRGKRRVFGGVASGNGVNQGANVVATRQQQGDQAVVDGNAAVAHPIEHAFSDMRKGHHMVEAEKPRRTLDGVRRAKDGVDQLCFFFCLLQGQQRVLHVLQQFAAFDNEGLQGFVKIHGAPLGTEGWGITRSSPK